MRFWLGTHEVLWLGRTSVPLFISHRRLAPRHTYPRAIGPWALDSGGYTELNMYGGWRTSVEEYVEAVADYSVLIGGLEWAAPMDWMCEPHVIEKTGLSVREHQERTVENFLELRGRGPFIPVLQGQTLEDYEACIGLYEAAGADLRACELVGLGTVCRRQREPEIARIVHELGVHGLRMHGFGMKSRGLARVGHVLASADSMAWSTAGRMEWQHRKARMCSGEHKGGCANCLGWALQWRDRVVDGVGLFAEVA